MLEFAVDVDGVPDRGPAVFAVTVATLALATTFVLARLLCRGLIVRRFGWDDLSILVAWLFAAGLSATIILGTRRGLGRHDEDIPADHRPQLRRSEYVFSILYNPALMAAKTSILIFYLRLSKNTQPLLRLASYIVLIIVNLAGAVLTLINIFQCQPIQAAFDDTPGRCVPLLTEFICSAPINIVTDLAILALPIPVLTSMRLPPRQKTILVLTFGLGVFVTVVDVVRIYYLQNAIHYVPANGPTTDENAIFGDSPQFSWNASLSLMWSAVEVNVGISTACIPTLKPLVLRLLPAMILDPNRTHYGSTQTQDRDLMPRSPTPNLQSVLAAASPTMPGGGVRGRGREGEAEGEEVDDLTTCVPPLATSNATALRANTARSTMTTAGASSPVPPESNLYFGFVTIKRPKSMLKVTPSESWKYCAYVTVTFLLWGISYGLLGTLNNVIAVVADMSTLQAIGLNSVYFGLGYLLGPLVVGVWILRHDEHHRSRHATKNHRPHQSIGGFKATLMLGLCIYGIGTICFWPAAVLASFPGFMVSNFIVGSGLAVLETAANPFLVLCGPSEYASTRLCLAQAIQAVGSVFSGLLAQHVYFPENLFRQENTNSLVLADVQWTYLAVTLFCAALALLFYYIPLPEVSDHELAVSAESLPVDSTKRTIGGLQLRTVCIILAVLAQYCLIAAQESVSIFFHDLMTALAPQDTSTAVALVSSGTGSGSQTNLSGVGDWPPSLALSVTNFSIVGHAAFAASRFLAAGLAYLSARYPSNNWIPAPRTVLLASVCTSIVAIIVIIVIRPSASIGANAMAIPIILFFFAEGPGWPLIFSLGLVGQGSRTKLAAAWLTMGASGPAFWPFVIYAISARDGGHGRPLQTAFSVVAALLCFTLAYPLYLCLSRNASAMVDPVAQANVSRAVTEAAQAVSEPDMNTLLERRMHRRSATAAQDMQESQSTVAGDDSWYDGTPRSVAVLDKLKHGIEAARSSLHEHCNGSPRVASLGNSHSHSPRRQSMNPQSPCLSLKVEDKQSSENGDATCPGEERRHIEKPSPPDSGGDN